MKKLTSLFSFKKNPEFQAKKLVSTIHKSKTSPNLLTLEEHGPKDEISISQDLRDIEYSNVDFRYDIFHFLKSLDNISLGKNIGGCPFTYLPTNVDEFTIKRKIVNGKFCSIFQARHNASHTDVVLKIYKNIPFSMISFIEREIQTQLHIDHPYILKLYCAFYQYNVFVLVLENALHGDLHTYRSFLNKNISLKLAKRFTAEILSGLSELHQRGIIHRDIKANNIFIDSNLKAKIGDFGACFNAQSGITITKQGTIQYMAPEVVQSRMRNSLECNRPSLAGFNSKCDIWSLGLTVFEMITGYIPSFPIIYPNNFDELLVNFLDCMIQIDPLHRATAIELIQHPWLQDRSTTFALSTTTSIYDSSILHAIQIR
jgi:serine/threonine protein kinase